MYYVCVRLYDCITTVCVYDLHNTMYMYCTYILVLVSLICRMSDELYLFKKSKKSSRWVD